MIDEIYFFNMFIVLISCCYLDDSFEYLGKDITKEKNHDKDFRGD